MLLNVTEITVCRNKQNIKMLLVVIGELQKTFFNSILSYNVMKMFNFGWCARFPVYNH